MHVRSPRRPARLAAFLAFASAAVSLYWTLGGTLLLDTVGGEIEELARKRSAGALAVGTATVLLKVAAGLLALALLRRWGRGRRRVLVANGVASAVLVAWGGANVVLGGLVLGGAIAASAEVDRHALRWHVFLWDLWFLVWGLVLALAVAAARRRRRAAP